MKEELFCTAVYFDQDEDKGKQYIYEFESDDLYISGDRGDYIMGERYMVKYKEAEQMTVKMTRPKLISAKPVEK